MKLATTVYKSRRMVKIHSKHLQDRFFNLISDGTKTCEIRMNKGSSLNINEGDEILFYNDAGHEISKTVSSVIVLENITIALQKYLNEAIPDVSTVEEGVEIYTKIYDMSILDSPVRCMFLIEKI